MIQEFKFRVQREAEESKRKQIEADGIAAFQKTVSQGISDSYLRWRGIEATLQLAQSPNTKIVIIGSGKDGLPIILGNDVAAAAGITPPAGAAGAAVAPLLRRRPNAAADDARHRAAGKRNEWRQAAGRIVGRCDTSAAGKAAAAATSTDARDSEGQEASTSQLTLPDVQAILSRISGGLLPPGSGTSSANRGKAETVRGSPNEDRTSGDRGE